MLLCYYVVLISRTRTAQAKRNMEMRRWKHIHTQLYTHTHGTLWHTHTHCHTHCHTRSVTLTHALTYTHLHKFTLFHTLSHSPVNTLTHNLLTRRDGWMNRVSISCFGRSGVLDLASLIMGWVKQRTYTCHFLARCSTLLGEARTGWLSVRMMWLSGMSGHGAGHLIFQGGQHYNVTMSAH